MTTATFEDLTNFVPADRGYNVHLQPQTQFWSVNGGYIAAVLLRVAGAASTRRKPVSLVCDYLRPTSPGAGHAVAEVIHSSSRAELVQVVLSQDGKKTAVARVWTMNEQVAPRHDSAEMPLVPHPEELRDLEDIMSKDEPTVHPFWSVLDQRPINRIDHQTRRSRPAHFLRWYRYRAKPRFEDVFLDAARPLPIIDIMGVPAALQIYDKPLITTIAPTIQLSVSFHDISSATDWFLCDSRCEFFDRGHLSAHVRIWSMDGALVSHGFSHMITKPGKGAYVE